MEEKDIPNFWSDIRKGTELERDVFKTVFKFYKLLTLQMDEQERLAGFGDWQGLDNRTVEKYVKDINEGKEVKIRSMLKGFDNVEYLLESTDFSEPKKLWEYLEGICEICEWQKECQGKTPANGCKHCKSCKHKTDCEQRRGTDKAIPKDCKILKNEVARVDNAVALPYLYFPLKYILHLRDNEVMENNEVLEEVSSIIKSLGEVLGDNFNIKYVCCIIRYAHLYDLIDHLPTNQKCAGPTKNPITWLFAYSRRSLSISRIYNEKVLEDVLKQIITNSIDDEQVKRWKECDDFEKDLLKSQEVPKLGSMDDLLEYAKEDISITDIVIFLSHFADITLCRLRPIDIKILQRCLCWKDYSFEEFFKKLPQLPEHLEEWFPKN